MPPANSPVESSTPTDPPRTDSPASFRSALRQLASPVPDYASTLTIQAEDDADSDNVSFLRGPFFPTDDGISAEALTHEARSDRRRREAHPSEPTTASGTRTRSRQDPSYRQASESHEAWAERMMARASSPYGERIPNQQSLYDWAPTVEDGDEEELEDILSELRQQQPNTHPEILRVLARANMDAEREARNRAPPHRSGAGQQEPSLRSAAILQSVRRNWRFSTRSRLLMSRYVLERERAAQDTDDRSNPSRLFSRAAVDAADSLPYEQNRLQRQSSRRPSDNAPPSDRDTLDNLRRRYLANPPNKSSEFERIIKYLHGLRSLDSDTDETPLHSRDVPTDGFAGVQMDKWRKLHHTCPHPTSWLAPGTSFTGRQKAAPIVSSSSTYYRLANNQSAQPAADEATGSSRPSTLDPSQPWIGRNLTSTPLSFYHPPLATSPAPSHPYPSSHVGSSSISNSPPPDRWTVKVAIHAVDYETMTLQGTMEAYNVPSVPSGTNPSLSSPSTPSANNTSNSKTTFSTYLEGELIDFTTHTLLTESERFAVKTTPDIDAAYWRKLEPFAKLSDEEIARALLDRQWIEEQLMGKYVLMRWKERCFVKPTFTTALGSVSATTSTSAHANAQTRNARGGSQSQVQPETSSAPHQPAPPTTTSFLPGSDGNGYGLSISGFYYVSLRRSDGKCEGLYYDPQSSPYQHLELRPTEGTWACGAWSFR